MKITLLLAAFALATGAAPAQAVAPGPRTGNPSNMPSAGSPAGSAKDSHPDNMPAKDKRMMRKSGKMKSNSDGTMKAKTNR